jgi:hypothetical protein
MSASKRLDKLKDRRVFERERENNKERKGERK